MVKTRTSQYNSGMSRIVLIAHNLRSTHNVGSLFRTAEGLGIEKLWLTGYTPYPASSQDDRLPHIGQKLSKQIAKTALGAESLLPWEHHHDIHTVIETLRSEGFTIAAVEQSSKAVVLSDYKATGNTAVIVGREVEGIESDVLKLCDVILEIPMAGKKESFNVVQAAAMVLFQLRFHG